MKRNARGTTVLATSVLIVVLAAAWQIEAQNRPAAYPSMAPLNQYLMDRDAEIALARTAAPQAVSRQAEVQVLTAHGYELAVKGTNGFVCVVERGWMSPFGSAEFWNPKLRGPICFNPAAARSVFPLTIKRTELILAGLSNAQIIEHLKAASSRKELPGLEGGAMSYMMSKGAYLTDAGGHNMSHLMIYAPLADAGSWARILPARRSCSADNFRALLNPLPCS